MMTMEGETQTDAPSLRGDTEEPAVFLLSHNTTHFSPPQGFMTASIIENRLSVNVLVQTR